MVHAFNKLRNWWIPQSVILSVMIVSDAGYAASGDCQPLPSSFSFKNEFLGSVRDYRKNVSTNPISGVNSDQAKYAIDLGLSIWNEHGNTGAFRGTGNETSLDLPLWKSQCVAAGIDYSLVAFQNQGASIGSYWTRCREDDTLDPEYGSGTQAVLNTYRRDTNNVDRNWGVGHISGTQLDLVENNAHEAGHTLGIGHPTNGEHSMMSPMAVGENRQRDPYSYDLKCASELGNPRVLSGRNRPFSSGVFSSLQTFTGSWDVSKGTVSSSKYSGTWVFSAAYFRNDCMVWTHSLNTSDTVCLSTDLRNSIGPRAAVWREDDSIDRVFYSGYLETPQWGSTGKHRVSYFRSSNKFSNVTPGTLSHCSSMSGWFTCSATTAVYSGKQVAVAWDNYYKTERTHFAWVNQNRLTNSASREIWISSGYINHDTLPQPTKTGLQSDVGPGLACESLKAGSYDCVLAYVPQGDTYGRIHTIRFYASANPTHFDLIFESTPKMVNTTWARSASSVAVWFDVTSNKWWLAFRPNNTQYNQRIEVYSSADGASWTYSTRLDESITGPSAVTTGLNGNNQLSEWN